MKIQRGFRLSLEIEKMREYPNASSLSGSDRVRLRPLSDRDAATMSGIRNAVLPNKGRLRGIAARPIFEAIIGHTMAPQGINFREDVIDGLAGWWCEPTETNSDSVILHLHGGWFAWGSALAFRNLVGQIARSAGVRAFIPDYSLSPEFPFPTAIRQAEACVAGLAGRGFKRIFLTGDSAGGNLALSLLSILAERAPHLLALVAGAVALSPVTDLTQSGESWTSRAEAEPFFVFDQGTEMIGHYLQGHAPTDPIASPLFARLQGLPPIRIHVGDDEVLRDDSVRYVERAVASGVDAIVDVWVGMPHGFLGNIGQLEAADRALAEIGAFMRAGRGLA